MELPTVLSRVHLTTGHKLRRRDGVGIPDFDEIELRSRRRMGKGKAPAKLARSAGASPAQVRPSKPPGSECCVRRQQCRTRSVHSGCVGCVIEPRNTLFAGGGGCPLLPNATWAVPLCEVLSTLPGSKSTSRAKGSRRNLGDPAFDRLPERAGGPHREGEEP